MDPATLREDMVDGLAHEATATVRTEQVGLAMREVPRHEFVEVPAERAYLDRAFDHLGSRVLAPSTAATLVEALAPTPGDDVLVVGAGVGYTAAVVAEVVGARNVHAVDISRSLVMDARENLRNAGYGEVLVDCADGAEGLARYAPFDRILVEATAVRPPAALLRQLRPGGRLAMPVGGANQTLVAVRRSSEDGGSASDAAGDGETDSTAISLDGIDGPDDAAVVAEYGPVELSPLLVDGEQHGSVERNRTAREERERVARAAESRTGWEHQWIDWERR